MNAAPGVVRDFFGGFDQPRVQIRGSGLQQNPVERGVLFLQDGLPLNRADGSYVVGLADPRQAGFIEVNSRPSRQPPRRDGGGRGAELRQPHRLRGAGVAGRAEGGSFGDLNGGFRAASRARGWDGLLGVEAGTRDGFRDYNSSEYRRLTPISARVQLSESVAARLFAGVTDLSFDVAGPLPRGLLDSAPERVYGGPTFVPGVPPGVIAGPNVIRDWPQRETTQGGSAPRVSGDFGAHVLDAAFGYAHADDSFRFPSRPGARHRGRRRHAGRPLRLRPTPTRPCCWSRRRATPRSARRTATGFVNDRGAAGARFGANRLEAATLSAYSQRQPCRSGAAGPCRPASGSPTPRATTTTASRGRARPSPSTPPTRRSACRTARRRRRTPHSNLSHFERFFVFGC
ncbi:MAG: hypothetical protein U5L45_25570 [Saprospiraceae bacterium]|nr:hypothetical protein [Saprospiraceae bacterium]